MNYLDYLIIAVIILGFILGFKDGLVRKIIGVLGLIIGVALAFEYSDDIAVYLAPFLNDEIYLAELFSGFLIFFITMILFAILKRIIHPFDKVNRFMNQLLGGIAGAVQIIFFISGFLLLMNVFSYPDKSDRSESLLYDITYSVIPSTIDLFMGKDSKAQNIIKDYIEEKESTPQPVN
ncbi:MAG: CvpA family protein [Melioribacteraceae bacterium]|nr:CvpA family protein [Melioribacteraceae bacterium]